MGRYLNVDRVERLTFGRVTRGKIGYIPVYAYSNGMYSVIPDPFDEALIKYYDDAFENKLYLQKIPYFLTKEEIEDSYQRFH
jgi:hypothetical protein